MDIFTNTYQKALEIYQKNPKWKLFESYLFKMSIGLRKEALKDLRELLLQYQNWNAITKSDFILSVISISHEVDPSRNFFLSHPLLTVVNNYMEEWIKTESKNSLPFRWLAQEKGDLELARKALSINSKDDLARLVIINSYLDKIWWSTHSLPSHFNGDVDEIRAIYPVCLHEIELLVDAEIQLKFRDELEEEIQVVNDYQKSQK